MVRQNLGGVYEFALDSLGEGPGGCGVHLVPHDARQPASVLDNQGWQIFDYADVTQVLSDPATFSSDIAAAFNIPQQPDFDLLDRVNILTKDPPCHRKLRALVSQVFTPRAVGALAPRITEVTTSLLDATDSTGRFDLVDALASPLPSIMIAELLGVSVQDQPQFHIWAEALFNQQTVDASTLLCEEVVNAWAPTMREMNGYMLEHVRRCRQRPADDLISRLTTAEVDDERLTDEEIVGLAGVLLFAGHTTTTLLLPNAVLCFDRHREAVAAVRADRGLLPVAIEEVLRFRSPTPRLVRVATTDTEIGGHAVAAGQLVILWIAAANRDAARFSDPDRFDVHRNSTGHLSFGHGIHFCIGAALARLETKIALNALLDRYQEIAVDNTGPIEFHNPWQAISVKKLPLIVA